MTITEPAVDRTREAAPRPIVTGADYIESLRGRNLTVYLFGEQVEEPVDHPVIRPSINAVAETYDLDPDLYVHVVRRSEEGIWIRGAKAHQTGCINSHWLVVMPTLRLGADDRDFAVAGAVPVNGPGITYLYGRQSCDTRAMEGGSLDQGNARFSGQEAMVVFDDVFIPHELVFMDGEHEFAAILVERFTCYHRRSYVCKSGVGDVLIGAAAAVAECNGVEGASHVQDKLVEMTHLNETIYSTGIASSYQAEPTRSGAWINDDMIANVCKHHVTRMPYEIGRLAQDLAGGLVVTLPSERDLENPETGDLLRKYLRGGPTCRPRRACACCA